MRRSSTAAAARRSRGLAGVWVDVWVNGAQVHDGNDYLDHGGLPGQILTGFAA